MEEELAKGGTTIDVELLGGRRNGPMRDGEAELKRGAGQVAVPAESRADVRSHV